MVVDTLKQHVGVGADLRKSGHGAAGLAVHPHLPAMPFAPFGRHQLVQDLRCGCGQVPCDTPRKRAPVNDDLDAGPSELLGAFDRNQGREG